MVARRVPSRRMTRFEQMTDTGVAMNDRLQTGYLHAHTGFI
jgi:hypothetical protein